MVNVISINEEMYEQYSSYVAGHPQARFGHDLEWAMVLRDTYGVAIEHLIALDGKKIVGICPLFFCRPIFGGAHYQTSLFPSYFGPICDSNDVLHAILEVIKRKASNFQYAEILSPAPLPDADPEYLPFLENLDYTYRIPLEAGIDKIFSQLGRDYKRILRKPKKSEEMELIVDVKGELINEFYKLYVSIYAHKHGFIPHDKKLFENIFARYQNGSARIYLTKIDNIYSGGIFTFCTHDEIYYAWSAVKSNSVHHPTHFMIWKMIQDGVAQGYNWFNMGESLKTHDSLNHFKREWGTEINEPCRYFIPGKITSPTIRLYDSVSWTKKIISHLPEGIITNVLSPAIRYFL